MGRAKVARVCAKEALLQPKHALGAPLASRPRSPTHQLRRRASGQASRKSLSGQLALRPLRRTLSHRE